MKGFEEPGPFELTEVVHYLLNVTPGLCKCKSYKEKLTCARKCRMWCEGGQSNTFLYQSVTLCKEKKK